ncbi:sensor histidine kinase [Roseateles cellulosilyticus]|uniref:histidine kinase n=1 Tax=Pelomonas cellulosilytica TaxID=2906762 RepID=A0ABS8XUQ3_9BURK|nr:GAF domain-containing sensor histidine kinase [Pelomonas sp. P8]MCE4555623.1 GAF domain-containing sensor histidine kinase [Pelomonas sp. P8]
MDDKTHVAVLQLEATPALPVIGVASAEARVLGHDIQALRGLPLARLCPSRQPDGRDSAEALAGFVERLPPGGAMSLPWQFETRDGQARTHELHLMRPGSEAHAAVTACLVDLSRVQFTEALNQTRHQLLEMVAAGEPLQAVLNRLTALIEAPFDGLYCSVLLLDLDRRHISGGAGPRLPAAYLQALMGAEIGPNVGSCGTAMHDDRLVIVDDIATHPLWADFRGLALPHGLRACWSAPIHGPGHQVVGSFAMYYREVRRPSTEELAALDTATHLAGIAIDQERRAEERRRASQWLEEQVARRTSELLAAQDELVNTRKVAALGQLLAGIAHEMNTPLGNALLGISALRAGSAEFAGRMDGGAPLKRQELADWVARTGSGTALVEQNVSRALSLVNRFRQLTEGSGRAERSSFELRDAVLQAWARVKTRLEVEHVELACDVPAGLALEGYAEVLQQVLEQLLENACVHGFRTAAGRITVTARRDGAQRLTLELRDDGAGMPAGDVARAFEPFFSTTFGQGGSGLGLFVAHSLVHGLLGGSLTLESTPGQGTVLRLLLPLLGNSALAEALPATVA